MKLSKTQIEVLKLMAEGWEMRVSITFEGGVWLQKADSTKSVSHATRYALFKKGLIDSKEYHFPITKWHLTKKGVLSGLIKY